MTMCKFWKISRNRFQSSAKVVDGNLILSLPDAINPIVWRMELGNVRSSALEVRANDNNYLLTLKTPKGDVHDIAPFDNRDKAVYALMRVSDAMEKSEGQLSPQAPAAHVAHTAHTAMGQRRRSYKWLIALSCIMAVIFLFSYVSSKVPQGNLAGTTEGTLNAPGGNSNAESGVPLSADDYLRGIN